jgi:hypothetical protein
VRENVVNVVMSIFKNIDEDQVNLLKCASIIISLTSLAALYLKDLENLGLVFLILRIITPFFWKHKNKARFKRGRYICEYRNKKLPGSLGNIFLLINISLFITVLIITAYFDLAEMLIFFLCLFITFIASYSYQFYIKAPVGIFYTSHPCCCVRNDPFERSSSDSLSSHDTNIYDRNWRYDPLYSSTPGNVYYRDYTTKN